MALTHVLARIEADKKREINTILTNAKTQAQQLIDSAGKRRETLLAREQTAQQRRIELEVRQDIATQEITCRRELLQIREDLLDNLFDQFCDWLDVLSPETEARLMRTVFIKSTQTITTGKVILSESMLQWISPLPEQIKAEVVDNYNGFTLLSSDQQLHIDISHDTLAELFRQQNRITMSDLLFGQDASIGNP